MGDSVGVPASTGGWVGRFVGDGEGCKVGFCVGLLVGVCRNKDGGDEHKMCVIQKINIQITLWHVEKSVPWSAS